MVSTVTRLTIYARTLLKFGYRRFVPTRQQNGSVTSMLWVFFGLGSFYFAYRTVMWTVVYLRLRAASGVKRRLDDGTIQRQDRDGLESRTWGLIEFYAGRESRPPEL